MDNGCLIPKKLRTVSCSVQEAGCLSRPSLLLKVWGISSEILSFSLCWKAEELGSNVTQDNNSSNISKLGSAVNRVD